MTSWSLRGQRAWVCGASKGIGRATALLLAERGAEVTLLARQADVLADLCAELPRTHGQTHAWQSLDLGQTEALKQWAQAQAAQGPVGILINNTGGPAPGPALAAAPEAYSDALRQHLLAHQVLVQALVPGMRAQHYGRIVNILSTSVRAPIPGLGVSNAIRAAVASWAKTLATELAPDGITVNNILPGYTDTERLAQIIQGRAQRAGQGLEAEAAALRAQIPVGRFAEPVEIAEAVAFLVSPAAAYITGVHLPVDGGRTPSA